MSVYLAFSFSLQKMRISHHNAIISQTPRFRRGTWSFSHNGELEKKSREYLNLRGDQKIFRLGELEIPGGSWDT